MSAGMTATPFKKFKRYALTAALVGAGAMATAVPALAQVVWGGPPADYGYGYYDYYAAGPGPWPNAGSPSHGWYARHNWCTTGIHNCY